MRLDQLGKAHVIPVARTRAQEGEVWHRDESIRTRLISGGPPDVRKSSNMQHSVSLGEILPLVRSSRR